LRFKHNNMGQFWRSTVFLAVLACLLWSTAFAGIKLGLPYTTPIQFAGVRFFIAGLLLVPLALRSGEFFRTIREQTRLIVLVTLTQTFVLYALFYWGISLLPGGITAITVGAQPFFVALVAHYAGSQERISSRKMLSISLGLGGIVLIALSKGFGSDAGMNQMLGVSLLILSNLSSGIGNVIVSRRQKSGSAVVLSSWQLLLGGLGLFLLSLFVEPFNGFVFPAPYYISLVWLSFLSAAAFTIWFVLLQRPGVKVGDLNIWKFIIPVFGAIFSWIIIPSESADWISVLGMVIIGISLLWYNLLVRKG
jgi:drug/metabolite transporter (DMT)-like permease